MRLLTQAELQKIALQKNLFAAGFLIVPLFALLAKILMQAVVFRRLGQTDVAQNIDLLAVASKALSVSGNSLAQLFFALGVASIFVVDYRYATWRHLVPRRGRAQLWLAKFLAALLCLLLSLALVAVSDVLLACVLAVIGNEKSTFVIGHDSLLQFWLSTVTACLEMLVLVGMASLLTIVFRSSMAAVLIVFLAALATTMLNAYLGPAEALWWLPSEAASRLREAISTGWMTAAYIPLGALVAWSILLSGFSYAVFARQELRSE